MPLKIVIKRNREFQKFPYAMISQSNYGRMDLSTPCDGLATFGVSICVAIIGHCPELNRTVLIHTTNNINVKEALSSIFDWIIAKGDQKMYNPTNKIEIVVFRGFLYNDPSDAIMFNHPEFMSKFRNFIKDTYKSQSVNIVDAAPLLRRSNGSLLVNKGTAKITVLTSQINNSFVNEQLQWNYSRKQIRRDVFADMFPEPHENDKLITNRHLQFDVNKYNLPAPINDECRLVLRGKLMLNMSDQEMMHLLSSLHIDQNLYRFMIPMFDWVKSGLPCEKCSNDGLMKCGRCQGAWYCSKIHQMEDLSEHKRFCNLHRIYNL